MLSSLFNISYTETHKVITIFNKIKLKYKNYDETVSIRDLRAYMLAQQLNSNLAKYRGAFTGKDILIVGGGSSLKYLDTLPANTINIGINHAFKLDHINFDYLFAQDNFPEKENIEKFINYNENTCKKFLGIHPYTKNFSIKNSTICRIKNKELYVLNNRRPDQSLLPKDISVEPLARYDGTVFSVLQFVLYANAERIFLAGFDCDVSHMFYTDKAFFDATRQNKYWKQFIEYKNILYDNCEIISLNPVNLKGLFKDVYTQSYVDAHPELLNENIEIIEEEIVC